MEIPANEFKLLAATARGKDTVLENDSTLIFRAINGINCLPKKNHQIINRLYLVKFISKNF